MRHLSTDLHNFPNFKMLCFTCRASTHCNLYLLYEKLKLQACCWIVLDK